MDFAAVNYAADVLYAGRSVIAARVSWYVHVWKDCRKGQADARSDSLGHCFPDGNRVQRKMAAHLYDLLWICPYSFGAKTQVKDGPLLVVIGTGVNLLQYCGWKEAAKQEAPRLCTRIRSEAVNEARRSDEAGSGTA